MIRRYENGDAFKVLIQTAQEDEFEEAVLWFDEVGAYSLIGDEGDVLMVFGYAIDEEGIVDCYALVSKKAGRCLFQALKFLRREMKKEAQRLAFSKMRMTVRSGFAAGARFAKLLGFHLIAELPRFYKEQDYQLFERME